MVDPTKEFNAKIGAPLDRHEVKDAEGDRAVEKYHGEERTIDV